MTNQDNPLDDIGMVPHCRACGSERVARDAWACWNREAGLWELETVYDHEHCHQCEGETRLEWTRPEALDNKAIRELNDQLRVHGGGNGQIVVTSGLQSRGEEFLKKAIAAMRAFDAFTEDNDPNGEHDFGAVDVSGDKLFWKIDYYDLAMKAHSPNAANPGVTRRVLTLMFASEY